MIRLIATDLDGTFLNEAGTVSPRNRRAIAVARKQGLRIVVVTARSHYTAGPILSDLDDVDVAVCSNGATLYDPKSATLVRQNSIAPAAVELLFEAVSAGLPGVTFGWETAEALVWDREFADLHPRPGAVVGSRPTAGVNKVLVAHPDLVGHDLLAVLGPHLNGGVTASNSGAEFVEVTGAGVDKAFGLASVCEQWAISATEVVAFGDQVNDVPMLMWAGVGVAMANAHEAARRVADQLTATNEEDGVAQVIETLL